MKSHRDGISASHEHHRIAQKIKAAEDQHPGTQQCNNMLINQSFFRKTNTGGRWRKEGFVGVYNT